MLVQRLDGPAIRALENIVLFVVKAKIIRQLTSYDRFLHKRSHRLLVLFLVLPHFQNSPLYRYHTKMKPRRQVTQCVIIGVVSFGFVQR